MNLQWLADSLGITADEAATLAASIDAIELPQKPAPARPIVPDRGNGVRAFMHALEERSKT